jgi:hypothetical protein
MGSFVSLLGGSANPYRDGDLLVVPAGGSLPPNCVKCGVPTSDKLSKKFHWHSSWLYLLIPLGFIFYFIAAFAVRKSVTLGIPFCKAHRCWYTRMNIVGLVLLIAAVPTAILLAGADVDGTWVALIGVALALSGLVVLGVVGSWFSPVYIDENHAKFRGAGEQFLAILPSDPACLPISRSVA